MSDPTMVRRKSQRSSSTAGIFDIDTDDNDASTTIAQASGPTSNSSSLFARLEGINRPESSSKQPVKQFIREGGGIVPNLVGSSSRHASSISMETGTGSSSSSSSNSSTSGHTAAAEGANSLAVPLNVPHHSIGSPSPTSAKHGRNLFDTAPSFSSPLAYAPLLPTEAADDFDLESSGVQKAEGESSSLDSSSTRETVFKGVSEAGKSENPIKEEEERSSVPENFRLKKSPKLDIDSSSPTVSPKLSGRKSNHASSSSTTMGPPLTIPRKSSGQSSGHGSSISSSSVRLPEGGEGGPKQVRALLQRGRGGSASNNLNISGSRRVSEATSEDGSVRSASGSSTGSFSFNNGNSSVQPGNSPNLSFAALNNATPKQQIQNYDQHHISSETPQNRVRSNTQTSTSSIHRRARSLGGSLLGELATSIGGPDGVDPDLVAAIRAGDADIPGSSLLAENAKIRQMHEQNHQISAVPPPTSITGSFSASSNLTSSVPGQSSVPSTPSGTLRVVSRRGELLSVGADTRALATSYPSYAVAPEMDDGAEESISTTIQGKRHRTSNASQIPPDYVRSRVRSQTTSGLSLAEHMSPRTLDNSFNENLHREQNQNQINYDNTGHGLGIGMGSNSNDSHLQIPDQAFNISKNGGRSASPMSYHDSAIISSASTSGRNSPVVWRPNVDGMSESLFYPNAEESIAPNKLSVQIPPFDRQNTAVGPVSALPAVNYSPQASPLMRSNMLYPPSSIGESIGSNSNARSDKQRDRAATVQNDQIEDPSLPSSSHKDVTDSSFRGRSSLNHAASIRGRGKRGDASARRLSTVQTPQGIDEYARIIIQSRNAKMQKWKAAPSSSSSQQQQRMHGIAPFAEDTNSIGNTKAIKDANESRTNVAATPNVSPVGSLTDHKVNLSDESGEREIEWVDWLDEYRRMKEAKLRVEKEEFTVHEGTQSEAKKGGLSSPVNVKSSPNRSSPRQAQGSQSFSKVRDDIPFTSLSLSKSLASNLDYGEGKRLPKRRPSELPIRSNQFADGTRSWSASLSPNSAFMPSTSPGTRSGDLKGDERSLGINSASLGRRSSTMIAGDKGRPLSLSPITSRIGSSGSQFSSTSQSGFGNTAGGRRKKLLGSKIEAWWGAVKSGFVGASNAPPASAPAHSRQSMRASIAAAGMGEMTREMSRLEIKDRIGSNEARKGTAGLQGGAEVQHVRSMFGESGFGTGHIRSQTHRQASEAKSVHTLRASSSAQNLKPKGDNGNTDITTTTSVESSVDQPPLRSDRSSVETAQQGPISMRAEKSQDRKSDTTVANAEHLTSDQDGLETMSNDDGSGLNSTQGKSRKGPKLSLHLEHGLSTFDAGPFGKLAPETQSSGDGSGEMAVPRNQFGTSKSSPSYREPQLTESPKSGGLSDAWKPKSGRSLGSPQSNSIAGSAGAGTSPSAIGTGPISSNSMTNQRGRSKLRDSIAGEGRRPSDTDKDITIDSIRRHIHHRLALSKENCDRELRKIIMAINAFVEEGIQEQQMKILQQQQDEQDEIESTRRALENIEIERQGDVINIDDDALLLQSTVKDTLEDGKSVDQKAEESNGSNDKTVEPVFDPDETQHVESFGGEIVDKSLYSQRSRQPSTSINAANKSEYSLPPPPQRTPSGMIRSISRNNNRNRSREITSTSTSRSHSPMPGAAAGQMTNLYGAESPQYSPARRMRPLPPDDAPLDPFIVPLQDLVSIAMDVLDTTIHNLTSRTGACREIISSVQDVGRAWEENPLWPGRGWYVQLLLAVAGLSRVVEWWEAERGFWNFAEDGDENDQKPIKFFTGSSQQPAYHNQFAEGVTFSSATDGTSTSDYNDPLPSTNTSLAKSLISSSPMRVIRSAALAQANANRTPSQQSSATNSPAIEPADRKSTFGENIDNLRSTHSSTPILTSALDDEDENNNVPKIDGLKGSDVDVQAAAAALPSSVKESQNILMELSLDGERFLYLSPAWQTVLGSDPAELFDRPIEEVLAPGDAQTFAEATQQLQLDDSHTVEAAFRLLVHPSIIPNSDGVTRYYQEMEGKGMLMQDRQNGSSSHTMWVFKPTGPPEPENDLAPGPQKPSMAGVGDLSVAAGTSTFDITGQQHPFLSTEPLLCRICERDVPTWFFEKHSEICNEIHRLEMEISESNEILADLRRSARGIVSQLEASEEIIEYRSIPFSTPAASTLPPTALEVANRSLSPRHPNPAAVRKSHLRALNALIDILRIAGTISTPATKDDADPIEKQRLLSPDSENKIVQVRNWKMIPLPSEDSAFDLLIADVDAAMRRKLSAVNRMLNTIVYVETVRMEWEQRVEEALAELQGTSMEAEEMTGDFIEEDESLATASKSQNDSEDQHQSSSTISHSEIKQNHATMTAQPTSAPKSTNESGPKTIHSSSAGQEDDLDDMEGDTSAVLLEQYDDSLVPGSTTLSARGEELGREEDIPAVETAMGGSILRPIPIPKKANITPRIRQMQRDTSAVSSSSGGDAASTGTGAGTEGGSGSNTGPTSPSAQIAPHSRRESIMSGERTYLQTPPLSPRHSPKEMTMPLRTVKDRRVSHSLRALGAHSPHLSASAGGIPISPRIPPMAPSSRPTASSIKDFDIIKPISKGAFGSVFLTRKRTTGDYFAIKVLKKSDMIAKNQITNVKAERMILMTQTQSPFVVKLFFTFQSSESLFLVMEYLPGGDLANLIKALGTLSEDWTRQFVAEVVNGLEMLHAQGVVHRDMKPDNLLIDQKGHLKLTDFGLSKIGLLGRQNRQQMQTPSHTAGSNNTGRGSVSGTGSTPPSSWQHAKKDSTSSVQSQTASGSMAYSPLSARIPSGRVGSIPDTAYLIGSQPFYVGTPTHPRGRIMSASTDASDSSGSEGIMTYSQTLNSATVPTSAPRQIPSATLLDSPKNPFATTIASGNGSGSAGAIGSSTGQIGSGSGAQLKKFVGTPDYLAPESILGLGMDDAAVDWWALGVILFEFLYGYPPFHASTPEKVFDNILSRNIVWEDEDVEVSTEARDLMERLMCTDRKNRLGANGAQEIKAHPFFAGIDWEHLTENEGPFVPQITDPESTDYFDLRGAAFMDFQNEEGNTSTNKETNETYSATSNMGIKEFAKAIEGHARFSEPSRPPTRGRTRSDKHGKDSSQGQTDEFGSFSYKNLPVLKQANDEVIKKMRGDQLNSMTAAMEQHQAGSSVGGGGGGLIHGRHRSISGKVVTPSSHRGSAVWMPAGPPSPTTSISSQSSVPSKSTAPTSPSGVPFILGNASGSTASYHMQNLVGTSGNIHNPHRRRPSEMSSNAGLSGSPMGSISGSSATGPLTSMMERKRSQFANTQNEEDFRRTSLPTRLRTTSTSTSGNSTGSRQAGIPITSQSGSNAQSDRPSLPWQLQVPSNVLPDITAEGSNKPSPITAPTSSTEEYPSMITRGSGSGGGLGLSGANQISNSNSPAITTAPLMLGLGSNSNTNKEVEEIHCMIAEDNPISARMLEGILTKLGCNSTTVRNGAEALRMAMGEKKYSVLFVDVTLPIVSGQDVAKMIKSTRNKNAITPIVALASFSGTTALSHQSSQAVDNLLDSTGGVFDAVMAKPIDKTDVCNILPRFGFMPMTQKST